MTIPVTIPVFKDSWRAIACAVRRHLHGFFLLGRNDCDHVGRDLSRVKLSVKMSERSDPCRAQMRKDMKVRIILCDMMIGVMSNRFDQSCAKMSAVVSAWIILCG